MKIYTDIQLEDFKAWSGAVETLTTLTKEQCKELEDYICEMYPDGINMTALNDFLWFQQDDIAVMFGYGDWDTLVAMQGEEA